ncbi:hypothetical protein [Kiloniella sp. b19]|uniref:hypothetical protein n=1 Tax=Kiloniella sp. GXU_MW_B19 TaxID=3141326 RepID=UPI0031D42D58
MIVDRQKLSEVILFAIETLTSKNDENCTLLIGQLEDIEVQISVTNHPDHLMGQYLDNNQAEETACIKQTSPGNDYEMTLQDALTNAVLINGELVKSINALRKENAFLRMNSSTTVIRGNLQ